MTLTFTDCKIKNNFRSLNASITGIINFIRCDFTGSSFNLLHSNKDAIVMTDCIGLPDDVALDTQNYIVKGITGYTTKLGAFLSHSYTANETNQEHKWSADQQKNLPTRERTFNAGYGQLWIVMLDH